MLGQLLPLRRLLSSRGILRSVRRIPLQNPSLLDHPECDSGARVRVRDFSSRPARPRNGSAPREQWKGDFNSRGPGDQRRGGSRAAAAGRSKSLIEDEAELSDWVSDLKKDSIRLRLSSDGEDEPVHDRTRGSRGRGRDRGGGRERNPPAYARRQNDSDSDDFLDGSERRKLRGGRTGGSFSRRRADSDSEEEVFSRRPARGKGARGRISSSSARKGGRDFDLSSRSSPSEEEEDEGSERLRGRGRGIGGISSRQGRGKKGPVLARSDDEDDDDEDDEDSPLSGFDDDFIGDSDGERKEDVKDTFKSDSSYKPAEGDSVQAVARSSNGENDSYLSQTRFDQCSLSPLSLKGIKSVGYERMTIVQEATLPVILKGKDVLAKAKTGTGKTVAFLLPSIEVVAKLPSVDRDHKKPPISVLVICPTRELAAQATAEAETLLKYHPSIGCQVITGGTRLALEQKRMQANPCQILVATPGRLRDHIENTPGFATRLMGVKVLVLDEADRLLDMGFRKDIEKIVAAVPRQRQTLLFSATVPEEVRQVCYIALKRDHEFVNTVAEGSEETHSQVKQMHLVAPLEKQFSLLYSILTEHVSEDVDYKVIIFCTTAMVTRLVADLLSELKLNVREIHSRKPQTYRTRISKEFRESKGLILVSSDVSARGVDYPNVTLVIQVGVPADREQYIHRLGRTGRRGKEGKGILMLAPWEEFFLDSINNLPITKAPLPLVDPDTRKKVERALAHVEAKNKESAYQAWLGYYNSNKNVGRDKYKLVLLANEFSRSLGLDNPPAIPKLVLRKMGLNNVPGLRSK